MDHSLPHSEFLDWSDDDRAKVIAHLIEEGDRCQMCGTKASEWDADRFAYVPETHMCLGCYIQDAAQEGIRDPSGKSMAGTTVKLVLNTPEKQAEQAEKARRVREGLDQE